MRQSPFHAYYLARQLEHLPAEDKLLAVFASSLLSVYPFQVAAATFALRSPYQKGVILCDESGMGKSHEAMMVAAQRWYEGRTRILICIPNAALLQQWVSLIASFYTVPYVVLASRADWDAQVSSAHPNAFEQQAIVITTYDFAAGHMEYAAAVPWDLTVFEEASALSPVYQADSTQARTLKTIAGDSFKLLLTGTPIEKNIMDLYGLLYFIDERMLPTEQVFLQRYLRRPEHYPELAERVSKYCFRTLRVQAKQYAKLPNRLPITYEYALSPLEQTLYDRLFAYCNRDAKKAFPQMERYDLALRLLGLHGSSTAAILQTIRGVIGRLKTMPDAQDELQEFLALEQLALQIPRDAKTDALLSGLELGFQRLKKAGAAQKCLIFTESVATQAYLFRVLKPLYQTVLYNGDADYSAIEAFGDRAQILLSTDLGARGFHLAQCSFVVQYDLLYNTLKMEQRIDRAHRLGQQNDVIVLSFIDKNNFADVRKLELMNKRTLVADGVLGLSDKIIGGFTDDLDAAFSALAQTYRTRGEIDAGYSQALVRYDAENRQIISGAEDVLFTTFTPALAKQLHLTPDYVGRRAAELREQLWQLVAWFFARRNADHDDCFFAIDEAGRTIAAPSVKDLPVLFYSWSGGRNQKHRSLPRYGMAQDFKPHYGRITLTSVLGRGIIRETACAERGAITVDAALEPCTIALYLVKIQTQKMPVADFPRLVGRTASGQILTQESCERILELPVLAYTEYGPATPGWLRTSSVYHALDDLVSVDHYLGNQAETLAEAQLEEIERIKLRATAQKSGTAHAIDDLQRAVRELQTALAACSGDRMKTMLLQREISAKQNELLKKQERQFFDCMQLDVELEQNIAAFLAAEKRTAKVIRQFVVEIGGQRDETGRHVPGFGSGQQREAGDSVSGVLYRGDA